jgi:N-acetylglutamate synthase-like GNAT family acetyltransferase
MKFETITYKDLGEIVNLQPDGWPDIVPEFEYYIKKDFCHPLKTKADNKIVGVGTSIVFGKTGWLAHIIVDNNYRKRGIGYKIVEELLKGLKNHSVETWLLIATEPGKPIYIKAGFRIVTEYSYLKRENPWNELSISKNVSSFKDEYKSEILELDRKISGENRASLLSDYLDNSVVFIANNEVKGYYIPGLREGLINADIKEAGLELMKVKYSKVDKAVLPSDNITGIEFLKRNGFVDADTKGTRMILGRNIDWKPQKIFSRIGGNFG